MIKKISISTEHGTQLLKLNKKKIIRINSWKSYKTRFTGYKGRKTTCVKVVKMIENNKKYFFKFSLMHYSHRKESDLDSDLSPNL
jgi:hypothetical protein